MSASGSVTFIDPFAEGHHVYYASLLASGLIEHGYSVSAVGSRAFIEGIGKAAPLKAAEIVDCPGVFDITELEKRAFLKKAFVAARSFRADVVHLLQLDRFIFSLASIYPFSDLSGTVGTLHWAAFLDEFAANGISKAKNRVTRLSLKRLVGNGLGLMAHSREYAGVLNRLTASKAACYVPYPVDFPEYGKEESASRRTALRQSLGIPPDGVALLAFGGTRFDKGADIAVEALRHLPENIFLVIAGKEEHFTKKDLSALAQTHGVSDRLRLCMDYVPEGMVVDYFLASDIVVAPYRDIFAGQCGPITIAATMGIPVVGPDSMIVKETVERYGLGNTFSGEDPKAFARAVTGVAGSAALAPKMDEFKRDHDKAAFCGAVIESYARAQNH